MWLETCWGALGRRFVAVRAEGRSPEARAESVGRLTCGSTQRSSRDGHRLPLNSNCGAPPRSWTFLSRLLVFTNGIVRVYSLAMKTALIVIGVVVLIVVIGFATLFGVYNSFVAADQVVSEKWAQVQNVYQRRADLIPNLVETVKGFAAQERTVLEEVTRARASASSIQLTPQALNDPKALERFQAAQNQLSGALSRLLVTVERYPDLKSNQNFLALQSQLEGTENRITVERRRFNEAVRDYNTRLRLFPGSLIAGLSGFQSKAFFEAAPDAATVPKVKF